MDILFYTVNMINLLVLLLLIAALFVYQLDLFFGKYAKWGIGLVAVLFVLNLASHIYLAYWGTGGVIIGLLNPILVLMKPLGCLCGSVCKLLTVAFLMTLNLSSLFGFIRLLVIRGQATEYPD